MRQRWRSVARVPGRCPGCDEVGSLACGFGTAVRISGHWRPLERHRIAVISTSMLSTEATFCRTPTGCFLRPNPSSSSSPDLTRRSRAVGAASSSRQEDPIRSGVQDAPNLAVPPRRRHPSREGGNPDLSVGSLHRDVCRSAGHGTGAHFHDVRRVPLHKTALLNDPAGLPPSRE